MQINNLNHIEVATQEVTGAGYNRHYRPAVNTASAGAHANAIGRFTDASTYVSTTTVSGRGSSSNANASSISIG